jgi:hypothetical protein
VLGNTAYKLLYTALQMLFFYCFATVIWRVKLPIAVRCMMYCLFV